jgi:hypothetical protein
MELKTKFCLGDMVYLKTDPDQFKRMVTSFRVGPDCIMYELSQGDKPPTLHYDFEIDSEPDFVMKLIG